MLGTKYAAERFATDYLAKAMLNPTVINGVENMLTAQSKLLGSFEEAMSSWMSRRRESLSHVQSLLDRMRNSKDITEVWQAQQEWMAGEARRLAEDASAFSNTMVMFTRTATQEIEETRRVFDKTGRMLGKEMEEAGEELLKAAGGKPGTMPRNVAAS